MRVGIARGFGVASCAAALALLAGCGDGDANAEQSGGATNANPVSASPVADGMFRIQGVLGSSTTAAAQTAGDPGLRLQAMTTGSDRNISHVMALNPEASSPRRTLVEVESDGSFQLDVETGLPYVLVFIDASAVGAEMVVGIFRAQTLDTLAPSVDGGELDLGEVSMDEGSGSANAGIGYDALLAQLGLSAEAAEYLGAIDDLSLRYANPDLDGNGTLDVLEEHEFALDFHVRANTFKGPEGAEAAVADITDRFLDDAGAEMATVRFNLASIYLLYDATFDSTEYVLPNQGNTMLQNGGAFVALASDGAAVTAPTSYSGVFFGSGRGFGPDYSWGIDPQIELPGSGGSPASYVFTLGGIATDITFVNIVTRTRASLASEGLLVPFIKLNTAEGLLSSVDYKWLKSGAQAWIPASAEEVATVVNENGGGASIHISGNSEVFLSIPTEAQGTIQWGENLDSNGSIDSQQIAALSPSDLCGIAVSYDDKLGMRIFAGGVTPNPDAVCP
ncbi:MAG TPA: hypothetical protein VHO25_07860 [Polyangiaceae bacterium]|nr:hypothetical protein [Polyangiaceae bacterium]